MAIYHASVKIGSRSKGQSAVAAAAYRSASKLFDKRRGVFFSYSRKQNVEPDSIILAPEGSPSWVYYRDKLWNKVEQVERRKDAQLYREFEVAIPKELPISNMKRLVREFSKEVFVSKGMVADICFHDLKRKNPHAHIMLSMRSINADGFGKKERAWNEKELLKKWRADWADFANRALVAVGSSSRIDHRSNIDAGRVAVPTRHLGPQAWKHSATVEAFKVLQSNQEIFRLNSSLKNVQTKIAYLFRFKAIGRINGGLLRKSFEAYKAYRLSSIENARKDLPWLRSGFWMISKMWRRLPLRHKSKRSSPTKALSKGAGDTDSLDSTYEEAYRVGISPFKNDVMHLLELIKKRIAKNKLDAKVKVDFGYDDQGDAIFYLKVVSSPVCREEVQGICAGEYGALIGKDASIKRANTKKR